MGRNRLTVPAAWLCCCLAVTVIHAFVPASKTMTSKVATLRPNTPTTYSSNNRPTLWMMDMMDASWIDTTATTVMDHAQNFHHYHDHVGWSSSNLLAFADQGRNLAGIFFQASLVPYLIFLCFLSFRANRLSQLGNFGFQFVLLFVLSTIPSGLISKSAYGLSLADTDWLHGGAESLLTVANVLIVRMTQCGKKNQRNYDGMAHNRQSS